MNQKRKDQDKSGQASEQSQLSINIVEHYIKTISFDNYRSEVLMPQDAKPEIKIDINVEVLPKSESQYEICLVFKADVFVNNSKIFGLNLNYAGRCVLGEGIDDQKDRILNIFCPNIIFPFARRVIADITRDGCFQPMLINHVDFEGMYNKKVESKEKVKE